jgi:hypothetical protein
MNFVMAAAQQSVASQDPGGEEVVLPKRLSGIMGAGGGHGAALTVGGGNETLVEIQRGQLDFRRHCRFIGYGWKYAGDQKN